MEKFIEEEAIHQLKHYLPAQGPLKDFIHHNTLHAFQHEKFEEGIFKASRLFGYKVSFSIEEFRELFKKGRIREDILEDRIIKNKGEANADAWIYKLLNQDYSQKIPSRIGALYSNWKKLGDIDLDAEVHSILFKITANYLDQGIAPWGFPLSENGFLDSLRELEKNSLTSLFKTKKGREALQNKEESISTLLKKIVGKEEWFEQYLFDQQFGHPGWSGLVNYIEEHPECLADARKISLREFIQLDLLLEFDALCKRFGNDFKPLCEILNDQPRQLFAPVTHKEEYEVMAVWQEAFEWSFYDQVLAGIVKMKGSSRKRTGKSFQALFCIDDREGSIRRHIENEDKQCETFGTAGFFGVEFFFQPEHGKFYSKVCPAPLKPKHLIKEKSKHFHISTDYHFSHKTHHPLLSVPYSFFGGMISAYRLFLNIFNPSLSPAAASSFSHMGKDSELSIASAAVPEMQDGLQIGFTTDEMCTRVKNVLMSIGLVKEFSDLVYVIGHGASSINNTHYAGYDCGACSGRPGSVNARVFSFMANHKEVRKKLKTAGIEIPETTQFIGGLHDTTRDEFTFYDEDNLTESNTIHHKKNLETFRKALDMNAKERSRRFFSVDSTKNAERVHQEVKNRSVSLFEPRPELNHATNALCIVGRRSLTEKLFLDRRAFSNSFDYQLDPDGELLLSILNACTPVCGGINLEYYFSRTDNEKLGAGSKLPHNVVGLMGVANGIEGDLRTGLPLQMIELHDPIRLLMIVEHFPEVVLNTIRRNPDVYRWYEKNWTHLVAVNPETYEMSVFRNGEFVPYTPLKRLMNTVPNIATLIESSEENLPVYLIKK